MLNKMHAALNSSTFFFSMKGSNNHIDMYEYRLIVKKKYEKKLLWAFKKLEMRPEDTDAPTFPPFVTKLKIFGQTDKGKSKYPYPLLEWGHKKSILKKRTITLHTGIEQCFPYKHIEHHELVTWSKAWIPLVLSNFKHNTVTPMVKTMK